MNMCVVEDSGLLGHDTALLGDIVKHRIAKCSTNNLQLTDIVTNNTLIPRLTTIIRSGITFVSRSVFISAPGMAQPFKLAVLC